MSDKTRNTIFGNMFWKASVVSVIAFPQSIFSFSNQDYVEASSVALEKYENSIAFLNFFSLDQPEPSNQPPQNDQNSPPTQNNLLAQNEDQKTVYIASQMQEDTQAASTQRMSPLELHSRLQIGANYTRNHYQTSWPSDL